MKRKKILVVTGTRAEYGLLRSTMDAIRAHSQLTLRLLVTGMHTLKEYGYTKKEIENDGYTIDCTVPITPKSDMLEAFSQEILGIRKYCVQEKPDCIVVLGDRDEPFAAAIVATHLNIPLAHIHGGDISGPGIDETLRHAITKMAHLHFPGTKKSAKRIRAFGEEAWRIKEVGSVVMDDIQKKAMIPRTTLAQKLGIDAKRSWLTVLQHPWAFDDTPLAKQISSTFSALTQFPEHEKIVLFPNTDTGSELFIKHLKKNKGPRFHLFPSLPRPEYMSVLKESDALIGNSSSGIIEISVLGTPSVEVGNRQAGRERGPGFLHVPYDTHKIVKAITRAIAIKKKRRGKAFPSPYGTGNSGKAIAEKLSELLLDPHLLYKKPPESYSNR